MHVHVACLQTLSLPAVRCAGQCTLLHLRGVTCSPENMFSAFSRYLQTGAAVPTDLLSKEEVGNTLLPWAGQGIAMTC